MSPLRVLFLLLVVSGCRTVALRDVRHAFDTDDKLNAKCVLVPEESPLPAAEGDPTPSNLRAVNAYLDGYYADGWRVMGVGSETTSYFLFSTSRVLLCFERVVPAPDSVTPPTKAPAPVAATPEKAPEKRAAPPAAKSLKRPVNSGDE